MPTVPKLNLEALSPSGGADAIQFGSRVFQCLQAPGVSYRNTPEMTDKVHAAVVRLSSKAGHASQGTAGPKAPQCVIANAICQGSPRQPAPPDLRSRVPVAGSKELFINCSSGSGWLPLFAVLTGWC